VVGRLVEQEHVGLLREDDPESQPPPLASREGHHGALQIAIRLVTDAGFEPVVVGGLARAKDFDVGTPVYGKALTAAELRKGLGLQQ